MIPLRRRKWTEAEEKTLIDKYREMVEDGSLAKMRTREKNFKPIACHVNLVHHVRDPMAYPWQWSWKDVSTKVQNMRHQYLLVKQKIKRPEFFGSGGGGDCDDVSEFDWVEGLTHWSNFLRATMDGVDNEVMGLGFEYEAKEGEVNYNGSGGREREDAVENGFVFEEEGEILM
ncbi:hypothetical protein JHK82_031494 [Glycine max]|nr:hypothetical protein JHK85_032147 [Glycine max]KAG4994753.1 hypothetical protein JHK86_031580 [Glycine max]KAG5124757.1 hypothetical protein JHK82_031494 [Glycine max]KAG5146173.1 hypothetical protein JHK84_031716 [Glycine max]